MPSAPRPRKTRSRSRPNVHDAVFPPRNQLRRRGREGLAAQRPGPKPSKDAKDERIAVLEKKLARAEAKLSVAASVIEFQKKVSVMLGVDLDETSDER